MLDELYMNMDEGKVGGVVFLDLKRLLIRSHICHEISIMVTINSIGVIIILTVGLKLLESVENHPRMDQYRWEYHKDVFWGRFYFRCL